MATFLSLDIVVKSPEIKKNRFLKMRLGLYMVDLRTLKSDKYRFWN